MSRATVRTAVQAFLAPPNIVGLNTVYRARPKLTQGTDYHMSDGPGFGALGIIHIPKSIEERIALGGPTSGKKQVIYMIALEVLFQSVLPKAEDGYDAHDQLVDAIITRIRSDRTFGTAGTPIWQAGEGVAGIDVDLAEPKLTPQALSLDAVIRFDVVEQVTS